MTLTDWGPNTKRLFSEFVANAAIPNDGGIDHGLKFFTDREYRKRVLETATQNTILAIDVVRSAPDNPHATDDEIAAAILQKLKERRGE